MPELSKQHKKALAEGRRQSKAVRDYLSALETERNSSRTADPQRLRKKRDRLETAIREEDNPARRVELIQQRLETEQALSSAETDPNLDALEVAFKEVVKPYSQRKGLSYFAWREVGVPAAILREAGLKQSRDPAQA